MGFMKTRACTGHYRRNRFYNSISIQDSGFKCIWIIQSETFQMIIDRSSLPLIKKLCEFNQSNLLTEFKWPSYFSLSIDFCSSYVSVFQIRIVLSLEAEA